MSARTRILVVVAVAAIAAIWFVGQNRVAEVSSVPLADGSTVRLKQVSFGKNHPPVDASLRERILLRLPTKLVSALGVRTRNVITPQDTLVLSFEWGNRTNALPYPQWLRVFDSNGLAFGPIADEKISRLSNGTAVATFHVTSFPRRQRTLFMEMTAGDRTVPNGRQHIGNFVIRNPAYAESAPAPIQHPASGIFDGERFTLLAIHTGLSTTGSMAEMYRSNQWTELVFQIGTNPPAILTTNIEPQGDWTIQSVLLSDGYGNEFTDRDLFGRIFPLGKQYMSRRDDGIALVRGAAWPGQPWRVRAVFQRNFKRSFDSRHSWTTSVRVTDSGGTNLLQQVGHVDGCVIGVHSIGFDGKSPPIITVRFSGRDPSYTLGITRVEDQRGSNVVWRSRGNAKGERKWELRTAPQATEARITFGVAFPVTVELSGTATILRTNVAHWAAQKPD